MYRIMYDEQDCNYLFNNDAKTNLTTMAACFSCASPLDNVEASVIDK